MKNRFKKLFVTGRMISLISPLIFLPFITACSNMEEAVKKNFKEPEITFKTLSIGDVSSSGIQLNPVFEVLNTNFYTIPLDQLSYELSFNEKTMLNGAIQDIGSLPANKSVDVTIPLNLNGETLDSFQELLVNNEKLAYSIKGKVKVLAINIPFKEEGVFYRPSISLGSFSVEESSFSRVKLNMSVKITNPNDFVLPISDLNYRLASGDKVLFDGGIENTELKQGENEIKIPLEIKPEELFSNVFSLLRDPKLPLEFSVDSPLQHVDKSMQLDLSKIISL